jgi:hypothetical protein
LLRVAVMRTAILVVLLATSACYGAAYDQTVAAPPPVEAQGAKVSQYCTFNGTTDVGALNAFLREQGERGWQLVGVGGQTATMYCFRFVAAR